MSVQHALLGDRELREPQREVLTAIRAGENVLAVFGTGQGKSVLYQIPAIESALRGLKTIIFHPLRALANDQFATMQKALVSFPEVRLLRANGSITKEERDELNGALKNGSWDILLATPEFARHHLEVFAQPWNQPALVVLDEAHHLYESRHRPAYHSFGETLARLGSPQTTAFTATARDDAFNHIVDVLGITTWVINPAVRGNLKIVDRRNELNRLAYLQALAAQKNAKTIVYCNSRKETFALASALSLGCAGVAAYNAEMDPRQRTLIEQQFRANELHFVVATSAFGEGIDLPDVRHVVLYHLNFNMVSFNQMTGRAGRDGQDAYIHLIYGEHDRHINEFILRKSNPTIETMRAIYEELRAIMDQTHEIRSTYVDIARGMGRRDIDGATVSTSVRAFAELGMLEIGKDDDGRYIKMLPVYEKVDVAGSSRHQESQAELAAFEAFSKLAIHAPVETLERAISRPIFPQHRMAMRRTA